MMANSDRKAKKRNLTKCEIEVLQTLGRLKQERKYCLVDTVGITLLAQKVGPSEIKKKCSNIKVGAKRRIAYTDSESVCAMSGVKETLEQAE